MGLLAGNNRRTKLSHDPNNTKWARNTTTFGQKILRSQGWEPGQFLGAQDASHAELHTAANASYIKVAVKDDMKGLGFDRAKEDEITGLDVFSDLLSRLNGKSEEAVVADQQARLVVRTHRYVEQKWGPMRFVKGGLLVGDKVKEEGSDKEADASEDGTVEEVVETKKDKKDKSRKRKAEEVAEEIGENDEDNVSDAKLRKRQRKEERRAKRASKSKSATPAEDDEHSKATSKKDKRSRKDKAQEDDEDSQTNERSSKRKSKSRKTEADTEEAALGTATPDAEEQPASKRDKDKKGKKEKKSKKEKKEKKESKKRRKAAESEDDESQDVDEGAASPAVEEATTIISGSATRSGTSTPQGSRNFVRSRFIAQKRQAVLDTKALNQIFMVKA